MCIVNTDQAATQKPVRFLIKQNTVITLICLICMLCSGAIRLWVGSKLAKGEQVVMRKRYASLRSCRLVLESGWEEILLSWHIK